MRIIFFTGLITIFIIFSAGSSIEASDFSFLYIGWGSEPEEVMLWEGEPRDQEKEGRKLCLFYEEDLEHLFFLLEYCFVDEKLVSVRYWNREWYMNPEGYMDDYSRIQDFLEDIYGTPHIKEKIYTDEAYRDLFDEAICLSLGLLTYRAAWDLSDYYIQHFLYNKDGISIEHLLKFDSQEYKYLIDEVEKEDIDSFIWRGVNTRDQGRNNTGAQRNTYPSVQG